METNKFTKGNIYVFSAKKYLQWARRNKKFISNHDDWHKKINGRLMNWDKLNNKPKCSTLQDDWGYLTIREWCKCVYNSNPQQNRGGNVK